MTKLSLGILGILVSAGSALGPCSKGDDTSKPAASASAASTTPAAPASASAASSASASAAGSAGAAPSASASAAPKKTFEEELAASKPLDIKTAEQTLGADKITAEVCAVEGGPFTNKSNMDVLKSIRAVGDRVFAVDADGKVHAYKIDAGPKCKLSVDKTFGESGVVKLENKIDRLSTDSAGNLWATNGVFASYKLDKNGKQTAKCEGRPLGYLFVHPSGKTGIGTFANATTAKVTLDGAGCKTEPWAFQDLSDDAKRKGPLANAQAVGFVGDTIFLGGVLSKKEDPGGNTVVLAVDAAGKEKLRMGRIDKEYSQKDRFGWVHAITPCKQGVCVLDSNYRRLTAWKVADGKFVGDVDLQKLFGLKYPWVADLDRNKTHTYFVAGQDRDGSHVGEGNIYRVTGL